QYAALWRDTPLADAVRSVAARGAPVGGTSSGLIIMGGFLYSAANDPVPRCDLTSRQATHDPFGYRVTLGRGFLGIPGLDGLIFETHLVQRDRMGRLATFLARFGSVSDGAAAPGAVKGVGIDRETALLVEPDGRATLIGGP